MKTIIVTLLLAAALHAQETPVWGIHTDKKIIKAAMLSPEGYWGAGEGGMFFFSKNDSSYRVYTKADGLSGSPVSAGILDSYGKVWLGCMNGSIDIIGADGVTIRNIFDIAQTEFTKKQINHFFLKGDTLFASTDFGISLINVKTYSFIDTYTKIGSLPANTSVTSAYYAGRVFLAMGNAVAVQKAGASDLSAPSSWEMYSSNTAEAFSDVRKFGVSEGKVIVSSGRGFSAFLGDRWEPFAAAVGPYNIADFSVADSLFVLYSDGVLSSYKNNAAKFLPAYAAFTPTGILSISAGKKVFATKNGIQEVDAGLSSKAYYPNGPLANTIYSMHADGFGNLWVATGKDLAGKGIFKYDRKIWSYFNVSNSSLPANDYVALSTGADGTLYAGSWGFGMTALTPQGTITTYDSSNSPLRGVPSGPDFIVITGTASDSKNNLWILNHHAANRAALIVKTSSGDWHSFENPYDNSVIQYQKLVIDQNDTKWFVSEDPGRQGLYYFNENKTFTNTADDKYGYVSGTGELAGKAVNAVAVDKRGEIWVGTNLGVYVLNDAATVLAKTPAIRFNLIFSLRQYTVTSIAVDAINRKWIGTNQGLLLVSPDGTTLLAFYTAKNSPLLSDQIRSLAFDNSNGILYIGFDQGIVSAATLALQPKSDLADLRVYPSPVLLDNASLVTIEGLVKDSEVKVLTVSGKLVKHIITPGGRRALWDCRDEDNNLIASGVYLVVAYDKDGNIVAATKLAAVRK